MKWKILLKKELGHQVKFADLSSSEIRKRISEINVLSENYDTVLSLDLPHYCSGATEACGGKSGWCYTFQGFQALPNHIRKVAFVDYCIKRYPEYVLDKVIQEVNIALLKKKIFYPNLRFSGSGELTHHHLPLIGMLKKNGINIWGFTKNVDIAIKLKKLGASVIFSYDRTSPIEKVQQAASAGIALGYTSSGVLDIPKHKAFVVFPLHKGGKVQEVLDHPKLCPKVVEEFLTGKRNAASCQVTCNRCHFPETLN